MTAHNAPMSATPESDEPNMVPVAPGVALPRTALAYTASRSSGPGGQNVNKLNTKAVLTVGLADLEPELTCGAVDRLVRMAGRQIVGDHLQIASEDSPSQHANRQACLAKLRALIVRAQVQPKKRRPTRPSRGSVERRLKAKRLRSETKQRRRQPRRDD